MGSTVDISGIDKVELLTALCKYAFKSPWGASEAFDDASAKEAVQGYIDYFYGHAIKCDLSQDTVDAFLYDRDAGEGTFQIVVDSLRRKE